MTDSPVVKMVGVGREEGLMDDLLPEKLKAFRKGHVFDKRSRAPRPRSDKDMGWMTQEECAEWLGISTSKVGHIERRQGAERQIVERVAKKIGIPGEELNRYLAWLNSKKERRPSKRTLVFFLLPALHNSIFWTAVLASAVDPSRIPEGDPYYGVVPVCSGESLRRCIDNLRFAYQHHTTLAAVVMAPPAGLPDEKGRKDQLVAEIEMLFQWFIEENIPVILLDRHLPGGRTPQGSERTLSRQARNYPKGVVWIGANDVLLAREAAKLLIKEFKRRFGPERAPIERIGVIVDDVRLTPQDRRLFAARVVIEGEIQQKHNDQSKRMAEELIKSGKIGSGPVDPRDKNHWGVVVRIDSLLHERPYGVICGSSQIAELTYEQAKRRASADINRAHHAYPSFVPAIISMDAASESRFGAQMGYANYQPNELVRAAFQQISEWRLPEDEAKGQEDDGQSSIDDATNPAANEITIGKPFIYNTEVVERTVAELPMPD